MGCGCTKPNATDISTPGESAESVLPNADEHGESAPGKASHEFSPVANPEAAVASRQSSESLELGSEQSFKFHKRDHIPGRSAERNLLFGIC